MAIDITQEKLIRLICVPKLEWLKSSGKWGEELDCGTPYRWGRVGLKGIKLETVRVGGNLCTSEAALLRFFERVQQPEQAGVPTESQRKASRKHAAAVLDAAGIK